MLRFVKRFLELEASGGLVLIAAAAFALFLANSGMAPQFEALLNWRPQIVFFGLTVSPSVHFIINDGLMTIFFLMVGLEIKREIIEGELSTRAKAVFPVATAIGGVVFPALIYLWLNAGTENTRGWAIASATDIAFSLGLLSLFGERVPHALKIFLMALAVIDDLVAILIIAFFYTDTLAMDALFVACVCTALLYGLNRRNVVSAWPYFIIGMFLWLAVLGSGVHATLAGVILGAMIPMRSKGAGGISMGTRALESIHPWVVYGVMPLFAFANAGLGLQGIQLSQMANPLPLGITLGLFFGKQFGILFVAYALVRLRAAKLPEKTSWLEFYAVSMLAGMGFTMSLFIGDLAFGRNAFQIFEMKLGVLAGSAISAIAGCAMMAIALLLKHAEKKHASL